MRGALSSTCIYAYDEESNRTSLTAREPGMEGKCASEGGSVEAHSYDAANRVVDTGVSYDPLGNTTKLPSVDAGGHELTSKFYVDGQTEYQSQNGQENTYYIDPAGRVRQTLSKGTTNVTATSHYAGSGEALSWKDEGSGKYTRLIPGIDGTLCATQTNGETPILQLHDLQGDVIATAALSETETKTLTSYNSTEFGVPVNGTPPTKYSWLGAAGVTSELPSGTLVTGTVAYVPQLGRALQTEAITPPGAVPDGLGSGPAYISQVAAWEITSGNEAAKRHAEEGAAEERAAQREAEEKILQQCREEGGCGVEGPEIEDPSHILLLVKPLEAIAWGDVLCNCSSAKGEGEVIEAIAKAIGLEGLGTVFEEVMTGGIVEVFGRELLNCGSALKSNPLNRCAVELHTAAILGIDTWIPTGIGVGRCFYYKKSYKGGKIGLHCPNKYYKRGSYK